MSKNYNKVKEYYDHGLWSKKRVYNVVGKWITKRSQERIILPNNRTYSIMERKAI